MAAERMLSGVVMRQATVLTFEKLFFLAGVVFLFVLPLLIFLKSPDHGARGANGRSAAHAPEMEVHLEI